MEKRAMKACAQFADLPKTYEGLLRTHMLRPIHDRAELRNALEVLDAMAGHRLNREQEEYFEALSTLVEAYERTLVPAATVSGLELLRHLLESNNLSAAQLSRLLGRDRSLGVRILNGERGLTVEHIKKLANHFGIPAQAFLG
jgi:HTH-type transcriptional regulator / antitoxin HigA